MRDRSNVGALVVSSARSGEESWPGYLTRLAMLNGYSNLRSVGIDNLVGGSGDQSSLPTPKSGGMAHAVKPDQLASLKPSMRITSAPRMCPVCWCEQEIYLSIWCVKPYVACHVHRCKLIDRCSSCNGLLQWSGRRSACWRCGCRLSEMTVEVASEATVYAVRAIVGHWYAQSDDAGREGPLTTLRDACNFLWFFGLSETHQDWRAAFMAKPPISSAYPIVEAGSRALCHWPQSMSDWLEGRVAGDGVRFSSAWLTRVRASFDSPHIVEAIATARASCSQLNQLRKGAFFAAASADRISARGAAQRLGCSTKKVAELILAGTLSGGVFNSGSRSSCVVETSSVERMLDRAAAELNGLQASKRLGISVKQVRRLREAGLIAAQKRSNIWIYAAATLDGLISKLLAASRREGALGARIHLAEVPRRRNSSLSAVIAGVLDGAISVRLAKAKADDLTCFTVKLEDLRTNNERAYTRKRAAEVLGVAQRSIGAFLREGALQAATPLPGARHGMVCARSVDLFRSRLVKTGELARVYGTSTRHVNAILTGCRVRPIVCSDPLKKTSAVWRRSDLKEAITALEHRVPSSPTGALKPQNHCRRIVKSDLGGDHRIAAASPSDESARSSPDTLG